MTTICNFYKQRLITTAFVSALALCSSLVLTTHAQAQNTAQQVVEVVGEGTVEKPQGSTYVAPKKLNPKLARVTMYRLPKGSPKSVAHLEINGHYHTSLQPGGFSEVCLLPTQFTLAANMVQADDADIVNPIVSRSIATTAAQNIYVRVNESESNSNTAVITPVNAKVAQSELKNTRRQLHVASRVADLPDCDDSIKTAPRVVKTEDIVLASDALFAFGKSDINGISKEGRSALDQLIAKLKSQYGDLENTQINVVGHADPLGNPEANNRLSSARAKTIRAYLVQGGLNSNKLSSEGRGDREPLTPSCGKTITPETIECNKPNRRVVVAVQVLDR